MKLENTHFANYQIIIDEFGIPVGVQDSGKTLFMLNDDVIVSADTRGFICSGVTRGGLGRIVQIARDKEDYFFGVLTAFNEFGYMKASRLQKVML